MKMLSVRDLAGKGINYHSGHLSRLIKSGKFPRPTKLSGAAKGPNSWPESVIDEWLQERISASQKVAP